MNKDDEILDAIKELANAKGNRLSLTPVYRAVVQRGIYTSNKSIHNALKRLEICGKIKATELDSIELLVGEKD